MIFTNAYFIIGTACAGKSTMIRMLAEKYSGVLCEENDQDRFLNFGFPIIHRDDDRTAEETLALVEKTFGLQ